MSNLDRFVWKDGDVEMLAPTREEIRARIAELEAKAELTSDERLELADLKAFERA